MFETLGNKELRKRLRIAADSRINDYDAGIFHLWYLCLWLKIFNLALIETVFMKFAVQNLFLNKVLSLDKSMCCKTHTILVDNISGREWTRNTKRNNVIASSLIWHNIFITASTSSILLTVRHPLLHSLKARISNFSHPLFSLFFSPQSNHISQRGVAFASMDNEINIKKIQGLHYK